MSVIERIRWTNVAKLGLAIAAGVLIAVGPHGCRARAVPEAVPPPRALAPAPPARSAPRAELRRPRPHRRRSRRSAPARPRAVAPPLGNQGPAPAAPRPPAPAAPSVPHLHPRGSAGEFF